VLDRLGPGARREAWLDAEEHEEDKMTRSFRTRSAHDRPGTLAAEPNLNYPPTKGKSCISGPPESDHLRSLRGSGEHMEGISALTRAAIIDDRLDSKLAD